MKKCKHLWMLVVCKPRTETRWCEKCGVLRITESAVVSDKTQRKYYRPTGEVE